MKISIDISKEYESTEIIIKSKEIDDNLQDIIDYLNRNRTTIIGKQGNRIFNLNKKDIYYFESIDNILFIYLEKEVYESNYKLYEINEMFKGTDFIQASKSLIFNLNYLISVEALFNGRYKGFLKNNEEIIINRHFVPLLKEKLGI